ncbi:hypothetical protein JTE90_024577 [Oedothorax gibbosus]|uniref:BTB domain-containing protein n=1 Tax=Oedothorax gibbosus TaxID=931172 RepID=A0AAV6VC64_9ARAC|nr:hypothetical protein JTE90_024577 [Oedothorax gibbosus]
MALIPINWNFYINYSSPGTSSKGNIITNHKRELYDYPAFKDLGTVLGTKYFLKLQFKSNSNIINNCSQVLSVDLERFCDLRSLSIHGSISIYERVAYKRMAFKAFKHSFKDGEKVFTFEIISNGEIDSKVSLHGHICVDPSDTNLTTDQKFIESCPVPEIHWSFSQISNDLGYLLEENPFSDITMKCGDVNVSAHRNILASRSPVFKAMLEKPMKENLTGEIKIDDMQPDTVKGMLNYIYCGKVRDFSEGTACDLLYAADKYQLLELKEMCVSYLKAKISNSNVFRILDVAVLHDDHLKTTVIEYIGENFTVIEKSKGWAQFKKENPSLALDVLTKIVKFGKC